MEIKRGKKENNRKSGIAAEHQARLRTEAAERQAEYDKLSISEKIARLDAGGFTATKQRAKLAAQAEKAARKGAK